MSSMQMSGDVLWYPRDHSYLPCGKCTGVFRKSLMINLHPVTVSLRCSLRLNSKLRRKLNLRISGMLVIEMYRRQLVRSGGNKTSTYWQIASWGKWIRMILGMYNYSDLNKFKLSKVRVVLTCSTMYSFMDLAFIFTVQANGKWQTKVNYGMGWIM